MAVLPLKQEFFGVLRRRARQGDRERTGALVRRACLVCLALGNTKDPGGEPGLPAEADRVLPDDHESLVQDVVYEVRLGEPRVEKARQTRGIPLVQDRKRLGIARRDPANQDVILDVTAPRDALLLGRGSSLCFHVGPHGLVSFLGVTAISVSLGQQGPTGGKV